MATDSLQVTHSGDYMRLNVLGNGLYFQTNSAVRGTMLEAGDLQWRHDILGYGATNNIGNSGTGRWGTIYGTDLDISGDITTADGSDLNIGDGAGTLNVNGKIILKHTNGTGIDVESSSGTHYDRVSYVGSSESSKYYQYSGIDTNVNALANGYAYRWRVQNTEALKIEYGAHVTIANDLNLEGPLKLQDQAADPTTPDAGNSAIWMSDGTGTGEDGDLLVTLVDSGDNAVTRTLAHHDDDTYSGIRFFQVQDDGTSTQAVTTSFANITSIWDTPAITAADFTWASGTAELTVAKAGMLELDYKLLITDNGNNRVQLELRILKNGTEIVKDAQYASRNNATIDEGSASIPSFKVVPNRLT
jgi:hypothetical protein